MGCNTSQELKTKDGAAIDAVSNGESTEPSAPQLELADGGGSKSSNNHTNHAKSNSIISNGDAKTATNGKGGGSSAATTTATNGLDRSCDKAEITELNDDVEEEGKTQISNTYFTHLPTPI